MWFEGLFDSAKHYKAMRNALIQWHRGPTSHLD